MKRPKTNFALWSIARFDRVRKSHTLLFNALAEIYNNQDLGTFRDRKTGKIISAEHIARRALAHAEKVNKAIGI